MAAPNYQFEKRRRDLAKQAKKKEKLARKLNKPASDSSDAAESDSTPPTEEATGAA